MAPGDDQELICRVNGDAPAGEMMRRYWLPALLAEELPAPDCTPLRVRLVGRNYVAFRDSGGRLGLLDEACPHRLASLALGRNEEGGLRCIYHGWKFGVDGECLEMPTEPEGYNFRDRLRTRAYPLREAGGIVWAYLGPPGLEPAFPAYEWTSLPRSQVALLKFLENANYLQCAEGAIDSAHTRFLHRGRGENEEQQRNALSLDLAPRLEVADTTYGFRYNANRRPNVDADRMKYVKITRYVFPTTAVTAKPLTADYDALTQIFVPVDDEQTMHYSIWHSLNGTDIDEAARRRSAGLVPGADLDRWWRPVRNEANWWLQDREVMRKGSYTGIIGAPIQDKAVQESMGTITVRSRERLGTSDVAIIHLRKLMRESVRRFQAGQPPIGLTAPIDYARLTHVTQGTIPIEAPWTEVDTFPGEYSSPALSVG